MLAMSDAQVLEKCRGQNVSSFSLREKVRMRVPLVEVEPRFSLSER
jgi:hypothetical protein